MIAPVGSRTPEYGYIGCGREESTRLEILPAGSPAAATAATPAAATTTATATPAAARTTASTTEPTATPAATCGLRTGFVHIHGSAIELEAIEFGDCCFRIPALRHFDKRKTAGLTGFPIGYDVNAFNSPESRESCIEIFLRSLVA